MNEKDDKAQITYGPAFLGNTHFIIPLIENNHFKFLFFVFSFTLRTSSNQLMSVPWDPFAFTDLVSERNFWTHSTVVERLKVLILSLEIFKNTTIKVLTRSMLKKNFNLPSRLFA